LLAWNKNVLLATQYDCYTCVVQINLYIKFFQIISSSDNSRTLIDGIGWQMQRSVSRKKGITHIHKQQPSSSTSAEFTHGDPWSNFTKQVLANIRV